MACAGAARAIQDCVPIHSPETLSRNAEAAGAVAMGKHAGMMSAALALAVGLCLCGSACLQLVRYVREEEARRMCAAIQVRILHGGIPTEWVKVVLTDRGADRLFSRPRPRVFGSLRRQGRDSRQLSQMVHEAIREACREFDYPVEDVSISLSG